MKNINVVVVSGNLGAAPEVNESNGVTYGRFSIAVNSAWKTRGGELKKRTDWIQVVAFNGLAHTLSNLNQGDHVIVHGSLQTSTYVRADQSKVKSFEVRAQAIEFGRRKAVADDQSDEAADQPEHDESDEL
jgi:single-strand DNA-binding protein